MSTSTLPVLLTVAEVAERLKVPKSWIYQRISDGSLPFPFLKLANHFVRIPENGLREYLQQQLEAGQRSAAAKRRERER